MCIASGKVYRYRYLATLYILERGKATRHTQVQKHAKNKRKQ